ncbi:MAG TPA: HAMP domain-containing sensor histidine kinase [Sedimentisphaerales bacterium]|nr:HAMP domain-containing sensor histidine kinase [Sedimentisphaerales bacterium]
MYRRLIILTLIIAVALGGLVVLGYHAVQRWAEGLKWKQFAEVAEQVRRDVERKLDDFRQTEQERPYTHYWYSYRPDNITNESQQAMWLRSPLGGVIEQYLAYGYFQIEPDGSITTANDDIVNRDGANDYNFKIQTQAEVCRYNVKRNLLPVLFPAQSEKAISEAGKDAEDNISFADRVQSAEGEQQVEADALRKQAGKGDPRNTRVQNFPIESLRRQDHQAKVIIQDNAIFQTNLGSNSAQTDGGGVLYFNTDVQVPQAQLKQDTNQPPPAVDVTENAQSPQQQLALAANAPEPSEQQEYPRQAANFARTNMTNGAATLNPTNRASLAAQIRGDSVRVRIEAFRTVVVGGRDAENSVFGKQVFLVRDVQIEDVLLRQGFQLNEKRLIDEVRKSAARFMRGGMSFELPQTKKERTNNGDVAYTAVLDFGFGYLILYLAEAFPEMLARQANQLQYWYFSIVAVVFLAVALAILSLFRYARAQLKLAEKKDDFISSVSHELRTPLTSIRMYAEMLENNWVASPDKLAEYYRSVRQESERLSRLIENVLDFSRIQKGRKEYTFTVGNLNQCIAGVVEMMRPYASQHGFSIKTDLQQFGQIAFDSDAIKQIIVNLLDNAVKYARAANDKTITVRTKSDTRYILIEVEDHGPGIPHRQRKKIFEEFYRLGSEATRETTGTGLGLALVKKFAQAHHGFVEILNAKPAGALFRVGLAMQS